MYVIAFTVKLSKPNECGITVKAWCYDSMKKNEKPHMMQIVFRKQDQPDIVSFSCSCAAGQGFCHHIVGFLFQLAHYKMLGLKTIPLVLSKASTPQVFILFSFLPLFLSITFYVLKDFIHVKIRHNFAFCQGKNNQEWQSIRPLIDIKPTQKKIIIYGYFVIHGQG